LPFNVITGSDAPGFGNVDGVPGDRPNIINSSILDTSVDDPDTSRPILNPAFFSSDIAPGASGNVGNATFRKDSVYNWDAALYRSFRIGKSENTAVFRIESLNLMNHPQFNIPGNNLVEETFGKITITSNKGLQIQFSLRLNFYKQLKTRLKAANYALEYLSMARFTMA